MRIGEKHSALELNAFFAVRRRGCIFAKTKSERMNECLAVHKLSPVHPFAFHSWDYNVESWVCRT